jgi:predicted MFS family arabinose efflux permease
VGLSRFLCLFAAQSALIAMSPVLASAARDLHVSISAAGQLRTVTGLVAGTTALLLTRLSRRVGLGRQLLVGSAMLAIGSAASAAAPSFPLLVLAQLPIGTAVALLTTGGILAAAAWMPPERRTPTLSVALIGQPSAWILGMPLVGILGEQSWRYGWLTLPLAAAVAAGALVASRAADRPLEPQAAPLRDVLSDRALARWLAAELFSNAAWAGTLVYSGALFAQCYGTSGRSTGLLLATASTAYVAGNVTARRLQRTEPMRLLTLLTIVLAAGTAAFGVFRPGIAASLALFSLAALAAGARTLVTSALALATGPERRVAATSLRAAMMQFGYFVGSLTAGIALAVGGYSGVGLADSTLFLAAAVLLAPRAVRLRDAQPRPSTA